MDMMNNELDWELLDRIANYVMFHGMRIQDTSVRTGTAGLWVYKEDKVTLAGML